MHIVTKDPPFENQVFSRICILGPPGSGKTTLAYELQQDLNIKLLRMNDIAEAITANLGGDTDNSTLWEAELRKILSLDKWITDGVYMRSIAVRIELADTIIIMDTPLVICFWRVFKRSLKNLFLLNNTAHNEYQKSIINRLKYFFSIRNYRRTLHYNKYRKDQINSMAIRRKKQVFIVRGSDQLKEVMISYRNGGKK